MKNIDDFTFLTREQIFGDDDGNNQLEILKKYGTKCAITDFSILLGGCVEPDYYTSESSTGKDRTGWWWTKSSDGDDQAYDIDFSGKRNWSYVNTRDGGARPAIPFLSISSMSLNGMKAINGIKEVLYGEYPQTIVPKNISFQLENAYNNGNLRATGKTYTTDSVRYQDTDTGFKARTHVEYEYNGGKYIRFVSDSNCDGRVLSDGRKVQSGNAYWVQVEPITWLVDEKADIALSKRIIFSGVQFDSCEKYTGKFDKTDIKKFMNKYFSKDIVIDNNYLKSPKLTPYNLNFNGVSDEDIIKGAIKSNIPVFLHGKSDEDKLKIVRKFDTDCEIICLRNASSDSLNGKIVYNAKTKKKDKIPPTWYTRVLEKCKVEPNKIHIIFFDEFTSELSKTKSTALKKILNEGMVNDNWKLPANARIVAAGIDDSLVISQMKWPLLNKFVHVRVNTTVDKWLKRAFVSKKSYERLDYEKEKREEKIHPLIYAYISYKSYSGNDVLRTKYTGNKLNTNPQKWEMASKLLYKTKQPKMLKALVGEDITRDFIEFAKQQVMSVKTVIDHNYSDEDLKMKDSEKFATAVALSTVDEEHFKTARDFMKKLGKEPRKAFEFMWINGNNDRLEYLEELKKDDNLSHGKTKKRMNKAKRN